MAQNSATFTKLSEHYKGTVSDGTYENLQNESGAQPGNLAKAAERVYEVVKREGMAHGKKETPPASTWERRSYCSQGKAEGDE